ncbi:hypothetical protein [Portibacter marinus]|uniref:hypothetical protein n=1 Tax=Portibacter marinus TaxID=2898660 RepID=UPI001F45E421|nr:hypothetical protein [Portibacter marinus]
MKHYLILSVLIICCKPAANNLEQQRAEVMKIHDDAMARMGEIQNAVKDLKEMPVDSAEQKQVDGLILALEDAEEGMMLWMERYSEPKTEIEQFYRDQKEKIQIVADDIDESIARAKKYME